MVNQRDFIVKMINRKGYFVNDDGSEAAHISVRIEEGEHPDYPTTAKNLTRGIEHCVGTIVYPAPEINGCMIQSIIHKDMTGSVPEMVIKKASEKGPDNFYESVTKYLKK